MTRAPRRKRAGKGLRDDLLDVVAAPRREDRVSEDVAVVRVVHGFEGGGARVERRLRVEADEEGRNPAQATRGHVVHIKNNERRRQSVPTAAILRPVESNRSGLAVR